MEKLLLTLGPAFAAGFAVQRLLEILDPIIPEQLSAQRKKTILGLVSLAAAIAVTMYLDEKIRVLFLLGITDRQTLDFVVTALIISAGTEGFNSIIKFLSYKKEETKAEAVAEKINAARAMGAAGGFEPNSWSFTPDSLDRSAFAADSTVEEALEKSLKTEIKKRWGSKFVAATWKKQPFQDYTQDPDDPKVVVLHATRNVASELGLPLSNSAIAQLQSEVDLSTKANEALDSMRKSLV